MGSLLQEFRQAPVRHMDWAATDIQSTTERYVLFVLVPMWIVPGVLNGGRFFTGVQGDAVPGGPLNGLVPDGFGRPSGGLARSDVCADPLPAGARLSVDGSPTINAVTRVLAVGLANCPTGKAVSYSPDEILVEGKLNVDEKKDDGYVISIFEVSVTSVKAAPR